MIVEIEKEIEELGFLVRQVVNIRHSQSKKSQPMFFVDLEPSEHNKEIFGINSLLHTQVKIEESHIRKNMVQCHNCQDYRHSRSYCAYKSRCVRCGLDHISAECSKS